jgi:nucleoside recognition membrane protein YjiH
MLLLLMYSLLSNLNLLRFLLFLFFIIVCFVVIITIITNIVITIYTDIINGPYLWTVQVRKWRIEMNWIMIIIIVITSLVEDLWKHITKNDICRALNILRRNTF